MVNSVVKNLDLKELFELKENIVTLKHRLQYLDKKVYCINKQKREVETKVELVEMISEIYNGIPIRIIDKGWDLSNSIGQTTGSYLQIRSVCHFTKDRSTRSSCIFERQQCFYMVCEAWLNEARIEEVTELNLALRCLVWRNWLPLMEACKIFISSDSIHVPTEEEIISLGGIRAS